jgi:hypothetical protein
MNDIRYFERHEIDPVKWDQRISSASNKLIYGYSWYLDEMADQWGALILNDYEAVMPLPWRRKWGFSYIYTPHFCNPLGIFSNLADLSVHEFLNQIPRRFRLWDLNVFLGDEKPSGDYKFIKRQNHILDLSPGYDSLFKNFRNSYRQIINKTDGGAFSVQMNIPVEEVIAAAKKDRKSAALSDNDYGKLKKLCHQVAVQAAAETIGVYGNDGTLMASGLFFIKDKRIYYVLAGNDPGGRSVAGSHHIINAVIKKYAGSNILLDFEGSDIPGIAFFFEGFGAAKENYYYFHYNALPWWCRWLKKESTGV